MSQNTNHLNQEQPPIVNDEAQQFVMTAMRTLAQLIGPSLANFRTATPEPTPQPSGPVQSMHTYESTSPTGVPITCHDPVGYMPNNYGDLERLNRNPSIGREHSQGVAARPTPQRHPSIGTEVGPRGLQPYPGYGEHYVYINPETMSVAVDILNNITRVNEVVGLINYLTSTCVSQEGVLTSHQARHPVMRNLNELRFHLQAISRLTNN